MSVGHIPGYRQCVDVVARERRYLAQVEALPIDKVEEFLLPHLREDASIFAAVDSERVVGWADILPSWPYAKKHCGVLGMGVLPEYRGAGLGGRLLEACVSKAWSNGLSRIELEVRSDNAPAIRLYQRFGFREECLKRQALRYDGSYYDALQMCLLRNEV